MSVTCSLEPSPTSNTCFCHVVLIQVVVPSTQLHCRLNKHLHIVHLCHVDKLFYVIAIRCHCIDWLCHIIVYILATNDNSITPDCDSLTSRWSALFLCRLLSINAHDTQVQFCCIQSYHQICFPCSTLLFRCCLVSWPVWFTITIWECASVSWALLGQWEIVTMTLPEEVQLINNI